MGWKSDTIPVGHGTVGSHVELQWDCCSTTLNSRPNEIVNAGKNKTKIIRTVTKTTLLPSIACLCMNDLTLSTSRSRVDGGAWVAKYVSAEKVVASVCIRQIYLDFVVWIPVTVVLSPLFKNQPRKLCQK